MRKVRGFRNLQHPLIQRLWNLNLALLKLHGATVALMERMQLWENDLTELDVEHMYERMDRVTNCWVHLVSCPAWQHVDDSGSDDEA